MIATKENSLIVELRTFAKLIGEEGRQAEFYRQMLKDAKPIEVVRLSEVFTDTEIDDEEMKYLEKIGIYWDSDKGYWRKR